MTATTVFVLVLALCGGPDPGAPSQTCGNTVLPGLYSLEACHIEGSRHIAAGWATAYVCRRADGD